MEANSKLDADKRRYIRYELLDYAQVQVVGQTESTNTIIVDVGLGGLQLRSRNQFQVGAKCLVTVPKLDGPPLTFRAEVRHSGAVDGAGLYSLGLRFLPESHDERMGIAEFVHTVFQRQCDMLAS